MVSACLLGTTSLWDNENILTAVLVILLGKAIKNPVTVGTSLVVQ